MGVKEAVVVCTDAGSGLLPVSMALPKFCTPITKTVPVVHFPTLFLAEQGVERIVFVIREVDLEWMLMAMQSRALNGLRRKHRLSYDVVTYDGDDQFGSIRRGFCLLEDRFAWTAFADEIIEPHIVLPELSQDLVKPPFVLMNPSATTARTGRFATPMSVFDHEDGSAGLRIGGVKRLNSQGTLVLTGFSVLERSVFAKKRTGMDYFDVLDGLAKEEAIRGIQMPHLSFWGKLETFQDLEACYDRFKDQEF